MNLTESGVDDAWTPFDAELMHRSSRHDAGMMLSMQFHYAWRDEYRVRFGDSLTLKSSLHDVL